MNKINVLIFPDGEINSVELHDALSYCVNIDLYGASSVERHGSYIFKNHISGLPKITDDNFYPELNKVVKEKKIDVIIPTHDTVSLQLIKNKSKISCEILGGDLRTAEICRSKRLTYTEFKDDSFVPKIYDDLNNLQFPVFVKPDKGQGAKGARLISNYDELSEISLEDNVICEFLPGDEYTVDCLTDKNGKLRFVSPRSRQRILAGVCAHGKNEETTNEIAKIAEVINKKLKFCGLWYFQIKKDSNNKFKLLEISNRCAGTMCLTRARGVNLPLLSVYTIMGRDISVEPNFYNVNVDRTLINRYKIDFDYEDVYIDLDDTIIINGEVNLNVIRFLYQCKNKNIPVYLLTKHAHHVDDTLSKYAISINLFKEIIHIRENSLKSEYIASKKSIFIDNAFNERHEVWISKNIPVFDVDAIEVLLDWRC